MSSFMKRHPLALATVVAMGLAQPTFADDTASAVHGRIEGPSGAAAVGTEITVIHESTGLRRKAIVGDNGTFSVRGLRVGGPYKIIVDSQSLQDTTLNNVYLNQGNNPLENITLRSTGAAIEEVISIGSAAPFAVAGGNSFGADKIANAASISRDLKDTVKRDPFAVADGDNLLIAGTNPKLNSFVLDGVKQNDDFGLTSNGYPTLRSPVSIDAVESVALNTAPMSVKYGGFSGGQINATVKSGTNDVDGSIFYEYSDDSMAGDTFGEQNFEETTWGGTIGFPIIKDKAFAFLSYETYDSPKSAEYGPAGVGAVNDLQVTKDEYNQVIDIAKDVYGVDVGTWDADPVEEDEKILAKFDYYINDNHRASVTYQHTEGNVTSNVADNSYDDFTYSSAWYNRENTLDTYALNLYSQWSDNFDTDIKLAYKDSSTAYNPIHPTGIGYVKVRSESGDDLLFGTESYRQSNELNNQNLELRLDATYLMGDHEILFGGVYNNLDIFNLFGENTMGTWEFDSIANFKDGVVSDFDYSNAASGNPNDLAADINLQTIALFVEDRWTITDTFELTMGLRYERMMTSDEPTVNDNFVERYGFSNAETFDGKDIFLPRVGFVWAIGDRTELSGGVGRFSGGYPNVWMANSYQNDGLTKLTLGSGWDDAWGKPDFAQVPGAAQDALVAGDGNTNSIDPNMDLPSDWRYLIELNQWFDIPKIGDDFLFTTKAEYRQRENDVAWVDLARRQVGVDETGRVIYETYDPLTGESTERFDIMMTNASENGDSLNLAVALSKDWDNGLSFYTSYTYSDVNEGNLGGSSRAQSNYQYPVVGADRNSVEVGPGGYMTEHRFTMSLSYEKAFFGDNMSTFSLFYDAHSGRPLNWVLGSYRDGDLGDQGAFDDSDAYLPYIPTSATDANVDYGYGLDYDSFMEAVNEIGLGQYAGQIIPKGADTQPWQRSLDFSFRQEIPGFTDDQKGVIYFDIENLLNLIDEDYGVVQYQSYGNRILVDYDYDPETGVYTYKVPYGQDGIDTANYNKSDNARSSWRMKLGVRYRF